MAKKKQEVESAELVATTSRNVVESYIFATGHQDLSIYSERLLMQLVKAAQSQISGLNFRDGSAISQVNIGPLGEAVVEIEARELLNGDNNTNYTQAKKAVLELMKKPISHERPAMRGGKPVLDADGNPVYEFEAHNLVNDVYINQKPGVIIVNVNKSTWEAILDFSKGFRRYDLQMAMKFSRTCSLRMYKLISNQQFPLSFTIQELREQWGLTNKYKTTKDFIKNTIDSAKEELDRCSPWTFDYQPVYASSSEQNRGRVGRKSITSITFFPKHQIRYESTSSVSNMISPSSLLPKPIIDRLVKNLGFSMAEIKANLVLFNLAKKTFELEDFLIGITPKAGRAVNPQGYVVNAIKTHLKEKYGVTFRKNEILSHKEEISQPVTPKEQDPAPAQPSGDSLPHSSGSTINDILKQKHVRQPASGQRSHKPMTIGEALGGLFSDADEQ